MYTIYKITNTINNKVYIGQIIQTLRVRFYKHTRKESCCIKLKGAFQKYGKEKFLIEQIDYAENRIEADNKEKYWIEYYKLTNDKYGYNILEGGHNPTSTRRKKVICIETNQIFNSVSEASLILNCKNIETLARVCRGERPTFKGMHFAYLDKNDKPILDKINLNSTRSHKKTLCIETCEIFNDAVSASIWLKVSRNAVSMCCRGLTKTIKGYHFKYI